MEVDSVEVRGRIVYDGECGVCQQLSQWLVASWNDPTLAVVSYQELGDEGCAQLGFTLREAAAAAWWVEVGSPPQRGHRAIARALGECTGWRRLLSRFMVVPGINALCASCYALFARYRHRLVGPVACRTPASA